MQIFCVKKGDLSLENVSVMSRDCLGNKLNIYTMYI